MRKILLFIGIISFILFLTLPILLSKKSPHNSLNSFDAFIVLGGGLTSSCHPDASLQARLDKAIELYHDVGRLPIIVTGGPSYGNACLEANAMKRYLRYKGIPSYKILRERTALNTYQNAYESVRLLQKKKWDKVLIITSDFHVRRTNAIFSQYDIQYKVVGADNYLSGFAWFKQLIKEQALLCFHVIFGIPTAFQKDEFAIKFKEIAAR